MKPALLAVMVALAAASAASTAGAQGPAAAALAAKPTPRLANGKPDLNGMWNGTAAPRRTEGDAGGPRAPDGLIASLLPARNGDLNNYEYDARMMGKSGANIPLYKPKYWDEINKHQDNTIKEDTTYACLPAGVPRMGAPTKIVQTQKEFVFVNTGGLSPNEFRMIPLTGPKHDPDRLIESKYKGDSVGYWEGDTLVVDSTAFTDDTWLAGATGWIHSGDMRVVERLTRRGDTLLYEVTVEDPEYLVRPWTLAPRTLYLNQDPKADLEEAPPCSERDVSHMTFDIH